MIIYGSVLYMVPFEDWVNFTLWNSQQPLFIPKINWYFVFNLSPGYGMTSLFCKYKFIRIFCWRFRVHFFYFLKFLQLSISVFSFVLPLIDRYFKVNGWEHREEKKKCRHNSNDFLFYKTSVTLESKHFFTHFQSAL